MSNAHVPMTREVAAPRNRGTALVALTAAAALVTGAAALVLASLAGSSQTQTIEHAHIPEHACASEVIPVAPAVPAEPPAAARAEVVDKGPLVPANADHLIVFEMEGVSYAVVANIDGYEDPDQEVETKPQGRTLAELPRHATPLYIGDDEYPRGAVAAVDSSNLPADVAAWRGQRVRVEGGCEAEVSGFALVSMITGSFDYMADEPENATPTQRAQMILEHGTPVVAAELKGCEVDRGVGRWARLSAPIAPAVVQDKSIAKRARSALLASPAAKAAQKDFADTGQEGRFWRSDYGSINTSVIRHPATGKVYASVHAVFDFGCGGAGINLWGLYELDKSGELREIRAGNAGDVTSIDRAIDVDGDGIFEFIGDMYLTGSVIIDSSGTVLRSLEIPFFGCSC